jgi:hypothetical protein
MLPRVRGLIARLRSFAVHLFRGGEEVIHEEEWSKLPPEEHAKWEPTDESTILWRRKPW